MALMGMSSLAFSGDLLGMKNVTFDGSLEVLGEQATNETDLSDASRDTRGGTITRVRLGMNADVTDGVTARVEAVRSPAYTGAGAQYGGDSRPTTLNQEQDSIVIENAYVDIAGFLGLDNIRLGRQYAGRKGDLIAYFGPTNDNLLFVNALDAFSATRNWGPLSAEVVSGKLYEDDHILDTDNGDTVGDVNVSWGTVAFDFASGTQSKMPLELGLYMLTSKGNDSESDNDNLKVADLRFGMEDEQGNRAGIELARNFGNINNGALGNKKLTYMGSAFVLFADYTIPSSGISLRAKLLETTGDPNFNDQDDESFHPINSDFRYGEILSNDFHFAFNNFLAGTDYSFQGLAYDSALQGDGLSVGALGVDFTPPILENKFTGSIDLFSASVKESSVLAGDDIGMELDVALKYKHSENVKAEIGYARLFTGDYLTYDTRGKDDVSKMWAKLKIKWGNPKV